MSIEVTCTECSHKFRIPRKAMGKKAKCPKCETVSDVPVGASAAWLTIGMVAVVMAAVGTAWYFWPQGGPATTETAENQPGTERANGLESPDGAQAESLLPTFDTSAEGLQEAVARFKQGQFDDSLALLKQAVEKNPELPPARFLLAEFFLSAQRLGDARAHLEQTVADHPNFPGSYLAFAKLAGAEGRLSNAQLNYDKALSVLEHAPSENLRASFQLQILDGVAIIAERRGQWGAAKNALADCLKHDPSNLATQRRLARATFRDGNADACLEMLKEIAEEDEKSLPSEVVMGLFSSESGDQKQAQQWMEKAVSGSPENLQVHLAAGQWRFQQHQLEEALQHAETALKLDPKSLDAAGLYGLAARGQGKFAEAETQFERIHKESPANFDAGNQLALVLVEQEDEGKRRRALELAEVNARQYPRSAAALSTLGWVYYRLGRLDDSVKVLQAAVSGGRGTSETAYYLAHVQADRGQLADAKKLLEGALRAPGP
ncbi:MAG: tetratricopeptide repeat protein, partial [Planctomycetales bacterium]